MTNYRLISSYLGTSFRMSWVPDPSIVQIMVTAFADIHVAHTDRQQEIYQKLLEFQQMPDFVLYLTFLAAGCPGLNLSLTPQAVATIKTVSCLRLARVFRSKDTASSSTVQLNDHQIILIRDECFKLVSKESDVPTRRALIDTLTYLAIYTELHGWLPLLEEIYTWIDQQQNMTLFSIGIELISRIFSELTDDDNTAELLYDTSVYGNIFDRFIIRLIHIIVLYNHTQYELIQYTIDAIDSYVPYEPDVLVSHIGVYFTNLIKLGQTHGQYNPRIRNITCHALSTLAVNNIKYVTGISIDTLKIQQITTASQNIPLPETTNYVTDPSLNIFYYADIIILYCLSCIDRGIYNNSNNISSSTILNDYDLATKQACALLANIFYTDRFTTSVDIVYRRCCAERHAEALLPKLYQVMGYTTGDLEQIEGDDQKHQNNAIRPKFHNAQRGNDGDDNDDDGDLDDDDDDDGQDEQYGIVRRAAVTVINDITRIAQDKAISVFLQHINTYLQSTEAPSVETGILLIGLYSSLCMSQLEPMIISALPSLYNLARHTSIIIRSSTIWTLGQISPLVLGLSSTTRPELADEYFGHILSLVNDNSYRVKCSLWTTMSNIFSQSVLPLVIVPYIQPFTQAILTSLSQCPLQIQPMVLEAFSMYIDQVGSLIDPDTMITHILTPFLSLFDHIDITHPCLPDWLIAVIPFLDYTPPLVLASLAPTLYSRCISQLSVVCNELLENTRNNDYRYDSEICNLYATTSDLLSRLIEILSTSFIDLVRDTPLPSNVQYIPAVSTSVLANYGTLRTLLNIYTIGLFYDRQQVKQAALSVIGELANSAYSPDISPILTNYFIFILPLLSPCLTLVPDAMDLHSNACWALSKIIYIIEPNTLNMGITLEQYTTCSEYLCLPIYISKDIFSEGEYRPFDNLLQRIVTILTVKLDQNMLPDETKICSMVPFVSMIERNTQYVSTWLTNNIDRVNDPAFSAITHVIPKIKTPQTRLKALSSVVTLALHYNRPKVTQRTLLLIIVLHNSFGQHNTSTIAQMVQALRQYDTVTYNNVLNELSEQNRAILQSYCS